MENSVTENNNFAPMVGKMDDEVFRSMKIDQNTKTPYSDATQVSHFTIEIWVYLNGTGKLGRGNSCESWHFFLLSGYIIV